MINNHITVHATKLRPLIKWVRTSDYGGPLMGFVSALIGVVAVTLGILAINLGNNTDLLAIRYIAKAIVILCCACCGVAFLVGIVSFVITAVSVGKRLLSEFSLFAAKK